MNHHPYSSLKRALFAAIVCALSLGAVPAARSASQADSILGAPGTPAPLTAAAQARSQALQHQARGRSYQALTEQLERLPTAPLAQLSLTPADVEAIARDNLRGSGARPLRIGSVKPVSIALDLAKLRESVTANRGQPRAFRDGTARDAISDRLTWVGRIDVSGADSVRLRFDDLHLPSGTALYIYNEAGDLRGPYQGNHASLWSHSLPITGGAVFVQLTQAPELVAELPEVQVPKPAGHPAVPMPMAAPRQGFSIGAMALNQPSPRAFCYNNASCIQDASCYGSADWPEIDQVRNAIAHYSFIQKGRSYSCTGGLVNDTDDNTLIPYFLTANHCVPNATVAATVETYFRYQTSRCGGPCPRPGTPATLGAELLDSSARDDHSLLKLSANPAGPNWYLGWHGANAVDDIEGYPLYRISHPQGSPQAYSTHSVWTRSSIRCRSLPSGAYIYSQDGIGATEGGSSGSPVLNVQGQIVGQLFGACGSNLRDVCDSTNNATVDGAFYNYYERIKPWLNPTAAPGDGPNLIVTAVSSPTIGVAGEDIEVSATVKNQGDAAAGAFVTGFYLSTDRVITRSDIDLGWICPSDGLAAGETAPVCNGLIRLPSDVTPGTYYLGAYADHNQAVAESDETNNSLAAANTISISAGGASSDYAKEVLTAFAGYFGRPPEPAGFDYYRGLMLDSGGDYLILVDDFYYASESQAIYGGLSTESQVNTVFNYLFARNATAAGRAYWAGLISSGEISLPEMAFTVAYNASDADTAVLDAKRQASEAFMEAMRAYQQTASCSMDLVFARDFLGEIGSQADADDAMEDIDSRVSLMCAGSLF